MLSYGLNWSQSVHVHHLGSTQEEADPLLQPVCLLLQAAIAGQLLEKLEAHSRGQETKGSTETTHVGRRATAALL